MACLLLVSCADQSDPIHDVPNFVGADSKTQGKLTDLKPPAPKADAVAEMKAPILARVTEGTPELAVQILPPASVSGKTASSPPAPDISKLIGLDSNGLNHLLGKPLLVRREPKAEVWQYRTATCVLHLFLYRDALNKLPYRVVHVEANHRERIKTVRASVDINSFEQKKLLKSCLGRIFYKAKNQDNPS